MSFISFLSLFLTFNKTWVKTYNLNKEILHPVFVIYGGTTCVLIIKLLKSYRRNQGNGELKTIDIKEDSQFVILGQRRSEKETGELWNEGRLKSWRLSHLAKRIAKTARMGHLGSAANNRPPLLLALLTIIRRLPPVLRQQSDYFLYLASGKVQVTV